MNPVTAPPGPSRLRFWAFVAGGFGLLACVFGAIFDTRQFLVSYMWAYWFWLGASIGCGQLLMIYHLVGGAWGFVIQRLCEAALRLMPLYFILVIPIVIGIPAVYAYADPHAVALDKALQHKSLYLNAPFVIVRLLIYFAIWWIFAWLLTRWSIRQDETGDHRYIGLRRFISGPGIILYALATTFMAVDWIMALEPDWYSTMFPGFYLVGQVLTALAIVIITLRYVARFAPMSELASPQDFHDLGNLLFTFVILWAYVEVSQLIITWSGNLPKEISWYLHRTEGGWAWVTVAIAVFHFALPFFLLLGRRNKLQAQRLAFISYFILFVHAVDNYWNVEPAVHRYQVFVSWLDVAAPIGLGGIWLGLYLRQLARYPVLAAQDPRVVEALEKA